VLCRDYHLGSGMTRALSGTCRSRSAAARQSAAWPKVSRKASGLPEPLPRAWIGWRVRRGYAERLVPQPRFPNGAAVRLHMGAV